ncbi:MAG: sulfotransferase family protein [Alphaproteobacteria bacterium]|nr:sulfotransferase family protein [Alphaproteobacteria bacterium]
MDLKVIGAGFGRTGTDSLRKALNILGMGPTHHMFEVISDPEQIRLWRARVRGEDIGWDSLLAGFTSCVDWPTAHYWPELVALNPQAKVVLTWRTPESWYASYSKTILPLTQEPHDPDSLGRMLIGEQVFGGRGADPAHAMAVYDANVEAVKATVPADRLLVHELGDGWAPLCAHLGVPVPDIPYPRGNDSDEFEKNRT